MSTRTRKPKRGPGRPPLDPDSESVELRARLTRAQAVKLDRLARGWAMVDRAGDPIAAAAVRRLIDEASP